MNLADKLFFLLNTAAVLFLLVSTNSSCGPGEYRIANQCCQKCGPGSHVSHHCSPPNSDTECTSCSNSTYIDHPNGLTKCLDCKICDSELGLFVKYPCTKVKNTVCHCLKDFYCVDGSSEECHLCPKLSVCQPGQWVKQNGTAKSDTICEECPTGTFSAEEMSLSCTPWTVCSGGVLSRGNSTTDVTCKASVSRQHAILVVFIVVVLVLLVFLMYKLKTHKSSLCAFKAI